jgi:hypothetical protein
MVPERFPYDAFYTVSRRGFATELLGNRETQSCAATAVLSAQHGKPFVPAAARFFEYVAKSGRIQ